MYDFVIAGAGLTGSILARMLANKLNKKILVLERRPHIAGNTYDCIGEHDIKIQRYGPHVFHTDSEKAYSFIRQYCTEIPYRTRCEAVIDGVSTPSPFNFRTIDQFYGTEDAQRLKNKLAAYFQKPYAPVAEMLNCEEEEIRLYAQFLFEKDYKLYTAKQWNLPPEEIDASVLNRVPVVFSYRDTYFEEKYEFIPGEGFTGLAERLLDHPLIDVQLSSDILPDIKMDAGQRKLFYRGREPIVIYTGAIDELFDYCYGTLPYRSLHFEYKYYQKRSFQNTAIVAYPQEPGYTRITEYTKMPVQEGNGWTVAAYEYPVPYDNKAECGQEPYYPVLTENSNKTYLKYERLALSYQNLITCGRLADFKYYNMDQAVLRALQVYEEIEKGIE